jgi:hypothetical protein
MVCRFKNPGSAREREPIAVNDQDFKNDAHRTAIP